MLEPWPAELERILFIQGWTGRHLRTYGFTRIHFAFLDAQHIEPEVNAEYEYIRDRQAPGDMIVFDDVSVGSFDGVVAAVDKIEKEGLYSVHRFVASAQRGYAIAERTRIS